MNLERSEAGRVLHPAAAVAVALLGILAMFFVPRALVAQLGLGMRPTIALGTVLLGAPALAALALRPGTLATALGRRLDPRAAGLCLLLGGALWIGSIGLIYVQALVRPPSPDELELFRRIHAALAPSGAADGLVSVAVIAVLPALAEELVMRGALLTSFAARLGGILATFLEPSLARRLSPGVSVFLTAALFAVIHDPVRLLFAFALGVVFGFVRLRTASLWPSVVIHATLNTLTFLIAPLVDDPSQPYTPEPLLGFAALTLGAALCWPLLRALHTGRNAPA
jgi:hypothetical protein